jgi:soluble lytic murein transglycosylase
VRRKGDLWGAWLACLLGCSRQPASCVAPAPSATALAPGQAAAQVEQILRTELPAVDSDAAAEHELTELVRREAYAEAAGRIDALGDAQRSRPTMKLVRARVAMALGDHALSVQLLSGLDRELPPIAEDIARFRAESASIAGPPEEAAQYWASVGTAKALGKAALAFDKAGRAAEARSAADRAIALGKGERDEAAVRALRARLAQAAGQTSIAADDLRFIVLRAPASDEADAALSELARIDPLRPLTGRERLIRAEKLADAGASDRALAELDRAASEPSPAEATEIAWARAYTLYKAKGRYEKAALLFTKLGAQPGARQAEAQFHAARALSRADQDDDAKQGYRAVVRRFPTSGWADDAQYLAARLSLLHGAWADAARAYALYLRLYPTGKQRDSAAYERALALVLSGQAAAGRTELHALATGATTAEAARLRELEAVAAARAGDEAGAVALWTDVARLQPLGWPAAAARARLTQRGAPLPPLIEPSDGRAREPLSYALPPVVELYHRLGLEGDAEASLRAREREVTAEPKGREREALCEMYGLLGRAARRYHIAADAVSASVLLRAPSPASAWAWSALYPTPYLDHVREVEAREGLPKNLVYAIMRQESAFDPEALSPARAVGLLQLMPDTARHIAEETQTSFDERTLRSPPVNIDLGARYLAKMLRTFDGSLALAAAAYNAGPRAVQKWVARGGALELDLWVALIPYEETRTYVARVMSNLNRYRFLDGGEAGVEPVELAAPKPKHGAVGDGSDAAY